MKTLLIAIPMFLAGCYGSHEVEEVTLHEGPCDCATCHTERDDGTLVSDLREDVPEFCWFRIPPAE